MYRVMIVDDSEEIRKGIKLKADWQRYRFEVCAEAQNGKEALDILAKQAVDLVITDIRMPIMNGLDFLRECSAAYRESKLVVLSGYDDFDYVKLAMQCGAVDYLLKPVIGEELEELLVKVKHSLDEENLHRTTDARLNYQLLQSTAFMQEQFILQLSKEGMYNIREVAERADHLNLQHLINDNMHAFVISVEMRISEGRFNESSLRPDLMRTAFQLICREIADKYKQETLVFYDMNYPSMMHFLMRTTVHPFPHATTRPSLFGSVLQREIYHYLQLETVIGIGQRIANPTDMKDGYSSALLAWSQSRLGGSSQIVPSALVKESRSVLEELERKLTLALEKGETCLLEGIIEEWLSLKRRDSIYSFYLTVMKMVFLFDYLVQKFHLEQNSFQELLWGIHQTLWTLDSQEKMADRLLHIGRMIAEGIREKKASNGEEIVASVCRDIEENYAYELSLAALAEKYYINAAYLSDLFHKQTGKTYSQYLFDVRMQHARLLLKDKYLRIGDIASLVGFPNLGYFSTVFKKHFGASPAEYRKKPKK